MYIPEHFRARDQADAVAFMRANPFAILVSGTDDGPFATHLPMALTEAGEQTTIRGHMAKANPHWRHLERQPLCLTIFHGAHSFVSPSHYNTRESVPTWNYGAVHAYGNARITPAAEDMLPMLHQLIGEFDAPYLEQWAGLSEEYRQRMLRHIVGFEIVVTRIEGKFKLSQNRTRDEQASIIASLGESPDTTVSGVARLMQEFGLGQPSGSRAGKSAPDSPKDSPRK